MTKKSPKETISVNPWLLRLTGLWIILIAFLSGGRMFFPLAGTGGMLDIILLFLKFTPYGFILWFILGYAIPEVDCYMTSKERRKVKGWVQVNPWLPRLTGFWFIFSCLFGLFWIGLGAYLNTVFSAILMGLSLVGLMGLSLVGLMGLSLVGLMGLSLVGIFVWGWFVLVYAIPEAFYHFTTGR